MSYFYFKPTKAIKSKDGIKSQSKRGAFAKNWWAQRWIAALERLVDSRADEVMRARGRSCPLTKQKTGSRRACRVPCGHRIRSVSR
jgi:hypothetical protein